MNINWRIFPELGRFRYFLISFLCIQAHVSTYGHSLFWFRHIYSLVKLTLSDN